MQSKGLSQPDLEDADSLDLLFSDVVWCRQRNLDEGLYTICTVCMIEFLHVQLRPVRCDIDLTGPEDIANVGVVTDSSDR